MSLTAEIMKKALKKLDEMIGAQGPAVELVIGGGGAMLLAYEFPIVTADIDGVPRGMTPDELDPFVKQVALDMNIAGDWLNPYYSTFTYVLPGDFRTRLQKVFQGQKLTVMALGREDLLLMKCFAHRAKDVPHARALLKQGAQVELVEKQIELLKKKGIPGTELAADFLDDLLDDME